MTFTVVKNLGAFAVLLMGAAACSTGSQTTGPQIHPGDLVRQQRAGNTTAVVTQAPTQVVTTMTPGFSNPTMVLTTVDQFCTHNGNNLQSVAGQLTGAGYGLWQTVETSAVGTSEIAQVYRKSGVAHAVFLQTFYGAPAPYASGTDALDSATYQVAINSKVSGFRTAPQAARAVGAQNVWDVNGAPHVTAVSVAPKYEWGATRSFVRISRKN